MLKWTLETELVLLSVLFIKLLETERGLLFKFCLFGHINSRSIKVSNLDQRAESGDKTNSMRDEDGEN